MSFIELNDAIISQVRSAADIVDVVGQFTPLRLAGKSHKGLCPFHREKTPSFTVDRGKGLFYCFGCGTGGDVFKFLMLTERFTFPEAVEYVAERVGIQLPKKKRTGRDTDRDDLLSVLDDAAEAFHQALDWKPNKAEEYLVNRGVEEAIWNKYGFGYAPDSWDYILTRLGRKYSPEQLEGAGLILPRKSGSGHYDRFRNRLLIPIHNEGGSLIGFGGRTLDGSDPKYLNSPESPVFNKAQILFNMHRAKEQMRKLDRAILVEGYFDCITLDAAGIPGVVASMGTSLTINQAKLLSKYCRRVVVAYDGDSAGRNATLRGAPILLAAGMTVQVLNVKEGYDPDTYLQKLGLQSFMEALGTAKDVIDVALTEWGAGAASLSTKEKTEKLESFVPLLAALSGVGRNDAAQRVADGLRLEFDTVWSRVRGRSTETVSAQRSVNEPISTGERQLLRAALHNALGEDVRMRLSEDYFEDPACKRIYSAIKDSLGKPEPLDFSQIATHLKGDEELRRLSELSVSDENDDFSSEKLLQILKPMERSYVDRRLRQIQYDINDAQRSADEERLQSLLQEKVELSRKLRTLK